MIFIHVGLHKTGTTFLQQAVYPKWKGVEYIPWPNLEIFLRLQEDKNYLVSREGFYGKNWANHTEREKSIKRLNEMFPEAKIIISFRRHAGYILSSYRQYLQRGGVLKFEEYFDIQNDSGFLKKNDFLYENKLKGICKYFKHLPFVFLHEEIRTDVEILLEDMETLVGGQAPSKSEIEFNNYNKSVGFYASKLLIKLNKLSISEFNPSGKFNLNSSGMKKFRLDPKSICQYSLGFLPSKDFITKAAQEEINSYYKDDWQLVMDAVDVRKDLDGFDANKIYTKLCTN